ncbi:11013_t:CDS:2 [Cetraspora pellucida]|uniref:11013_t:CDS:1 n=1 Tax=Cetraspora pellucida TaxID=1433469 RepID=A0ACA9PMT3_9GLOM|nr:11013_t:CDS:2 [Cetraspora pellucida]
MKRHYANKHKNEYQEIERKNNERKIERKIKGRNRSSKISKDEKKKKNSIIINYDNDKQLKEGKYSQVILENVVIENISFLKQRIEFESINFNGDIVFIEVKSRVDYGNRQADYLAKDGAYKDFEG